MFVAVVDVRHVCIGNTFTSNVTKRTYNVRSPINGRTLDCGSSNVIYLISCRRCGVQYVGKTAQTLRSRLNNHRNRLKQLVDLHLYNHFSSDGHSVNDVDIMPIEEVMLELNDKLTLASKLLTREEFWTRELCSLYPYGLNDNIRGVGNVSKKLSQGLVVYSLFNKQQRKFRRRNGKRNKKRLHSELIDIQFRRLLLLYKSLGFSNSIRTYILALPHRKMSMVLNTTEEILLGDGISSRIALLVKDLVAYRNRVHVSLHDSDSVDNNTKRGFLNVHFHSKGMDMVNLPSILHSKRVVASIPRYLSNSTPPIVSYSYPRTVAGKIFNFKKAVSELSFDTGTSTMSCDCATSPYIYTPVKHIVTGNLNIITNKRVRKLLTKGPAYREQNNVNWNKIEEICIEAIARYRVKWARDERVDVRVLGDWEHEVATCIKNRVRRYKGKHLGARKRQVLRSNRELEYIKDLHRQYVLVPADKAANNIIMVCKKYYLDMVMSELSPGMSIANTYTECTTNYHTLVNTHVEEMRIWNISVPPTMLELPSLYWLRKMHKNPYSARFIATSSK